MLDGDPCSIIENEFVKPGKGQAFSRVKIRNLKTGRMMPEDGIEQLSGYDAIFLGAVGFPSVPDHISLWGLLMPIRKQMQQYINLRPIRLLKGMASPLQGRGRHDT